MSAVFCFHLTLSFLPAKLHSVSHFSSGNSEKKTALYFFPLMHFVPNPGNKQQIFKKRNPTSNSADILSTAEVIWAQKGAILSSPMGTASLHVCSQLWKIYANLLNTTEQRVLNQWKCQWFKIQMMRPGRAGQPHVTLPQTYCTISADDQCWTRPLPYCTLLSSSSLFCPSFVLLRAECGYGGAAQLFATQSNS